MNSHPLRIGDIAKRSGVTVETLRFYEKEQLLAPQGRSESGYRLYSDDDLQRVMFILHAKKVGFTLAEIKKLLALRLNSDKHTCEEVKEYTAEKITEIEERLLAFQAIHKALTQLHDACCGGPRKATHCSILSSLEENSFLHDKDR